MKFASLTIFLLILLDHLHLKFPGFEWELMVLFRNIVIVLLCICSFIQTKKTAINIRSIYAVGIIFSITSLIYYILWWIFDINTIFVFPVSFFGCMALFFFTSLKNYKFESDKIIDDNVYLCFWKPENAKTIFPSLVGSAIGSISIYAGGHIYGFEWKSDRFKKRQRLPKTIEKKFVVINTGKKFTQSIEKELKKLNLCHASIGKIKLLRFKCVYAIRNVLNIIGKEFSPSFFEFIPALYVKKILRWKNGRKYKA